MVLHPNLGPTIDTLRAKFPSPSSVTIHAGATVVLEGSGIVVEHLDVKGTLIVEAVDGAHVGECGPTRHAVPLLGRGGVVLNGNGSRWYSRVLLARMLSRGWGCVPWSFLCVRA